MNMKIFSIIYLGIFRNLDTVETIDTMHLGNLCQQTEGKTIPFDKIQSAVNFINPVKRGELSKDEFIRVRVAKDYDINFILSLGYRFP